MTKHAAEVVINSASGSVTAEQTRATLEQAFSEVGLDAVIHFARSGGDLEKYSKMAAEGAADIIVGGGGDGTISLIATAAAKAGKTLGVLPLGTLNNFSKDLRIPQPLDEAVRVLGEGKSIEIDLGEVNGQTFINNSSIGLYPRIVRKRVQQQQRLGYSKWRAAFWAAVRVFQISPFLKVHIELDGKSFLRKTPFVFVGNNQYEIDLLKIGRRESIDQGRISIYFLRRGGRWGVILLLLKTLTGTVRQWRDFEEIMTDSVTIQTRRRRLHVAIDGEVVMMETPLHYKTLPKALKVMVPEDSDNA